MENNPKLGSYNIRQLEQITGVKAHTIRIWEQRYDLLTPERTSTNIRYYSADQLKKLLNISALLRKGMKISKISKLPEPQLTSHLSNLYGDQAVEPEIEDSVNTLVVASVDFDEKLFESVFDLAIQKLGYYEAIIKVIFPFLHKVGVLWRTAQIHPGEEHFVSNLIRQKIIARIDQIQFAAKPHSKRFVLFLPEWETHELSLILSNYIIRENGHQSIYLGQGLPTKDLAEVVRVTKPDVLVFMVVAPQTSSKMTALFKQLSSIPSLPTVLLSGNTEHKPYFESDKRFIWLNCPDDLIQHSIQ